MRWGKTVPAPGDPGQLPPTATLNMKKKGLLNGLVPLVMSAV
jgi:hypothetical protein